MEELKARGVFPNVGITLSSSNTVVDEQPVTPSIESPVVSRPVTPTLPAFSQSANVINVTINYGGKGKSSEEQ
ncbi:hypothetical protein C1645_834543 [Glomus cerebriforme]|uniref:Uncharacterized protein n=1 Tax=Glomus cerebriforme TaxID=658196 RepID=A0A397SDJ7_9GLOM|nr:hypothetical protein C1645_834543 [Glomus cerebriforme]